MPDNFQNAYYRDFVKELLKRKKKIVKDVKESIIDIPRRTYAPGVFDDADTNNPKLKQVVRDMIDAQLKQFAEYHPIKKYSLIGSILTKRYRDDADLDINILFWLKSTKHIANSPSNNLVNSGPCFSYKSIICIQIWVFLISFSFLNFFS